MSDLKMGERGRERELKMDVELIDGCAKKTRITLVVLCFTAFKKKTAARTKASTTFTKFARRSEKNKT